MVVVVVVVGIDEGPSAEAQHADFTCARARLDPQSELMEVLIRHQVQLFDWVIVIQAFEGSLNLKSKLRKRLRQAV